MPVWVLLTQSNQLYLTNAPLCFEPTDITMVVCTGSVTEAYGFMRLVDLLRVTRAFTLEQCCVGASAALQREAIPNPSSATLYNLFVK